RSTSRARPAFKVNNCPLPFPTHTPPSVSTQLVPALTDANAGVWFNCVDTDGGVWVGNGNGQLFTLKAGRAREVERGDGAYNLFCGADGRVYFLHESGITLFR